MKKALGQTVRDLKREVNKKVLKVPGLERKVLDATSNEAWGPHGSHLADIAQASRNHTEFQMIMGVLWKRLSDTGKNWRHVYKALIVLEYLVANGSERVIVEIKEHAHQISILSEFQYVDSSGRDQGKNVRRKSQSLLFLVSDKDRIQEIRQKASANREKFGKPAASLSPGGYGDHYNEENRNGYGKDVRYGRYGDASSRDGDRSDRESETRYSRDGSVDDEHQERDRNINDQNNVSEKRSAEIDGNPATDDGYSSSRGSGVKPDDHSQDGSRNENQSYSEKNSGDPPSYEEAVSEVSSSVHGERGGDPTVAAPRPTSPPPTSSTTHSTTEHETSGPTVVNGPFNYDEFNPRDSASAAPAVTLNGTEVDLLGSLSEPFSHDSAELQSSSATDSGVDVLMNSGSAATLSTTSSSFSQPFEDPFGDGSFRAIPSTDGNAAQTQNPPFQTTMDQGLELLPAQSVGPQTDTVYNFDYGTPFGHVTYTTSAMPNDQFSSAITQIVPRGFHDLETDILAGILPPTGIVASSSTASQETFQTLPGQPYISNNAFGGHHQQSGAIPPLTSHVADGGDFYQQLGSSVPTFMAPFGQTDPNSQKCDGGILQQSGFTLQVTSSVAPESSFGANTQHYTNGSIPQQPSLSLSSHMALKGQKEPNAQHYLQQSVSSVPSHIAPSQPNDGGGFIQQHGKPQMAYRVQNDQNSGGFLHQPGSSLGNPHINSQQPGAPQIISQGQNHDIGFLHKLSASSSQATSHIDRGSSYEPNAQQNIGEFLQQPTALGNLPMNPPSSMHIAHQGLKEQNSQNSGGFPHRHSASTAPGAPHMVPGSLYLSNAYQNNGGVFQQPGSSLGNPPMNSQGQIESTQNYNGRFLQHKQESQVAGQYNGGKFLPSSVSAQFSPHHGDTAPNQNRIALGGNVTQGGSHNQITAQPSVSITAGPLALVPQPTQDKFETKSTVWADTLSRGLVNLNISGSKTNPLADIGIDFDAINRKEKRTEKAAATPVVSTVTMGKAMGSGSGIGRAGATSLRSSASPMMNLGSGAGSALGQGSGMAGYEGMNQQRMGRFGGMSQQQPMGAFGAMNQQPMGGLGGMPQRQMGMGFGPGGIGMGMNMGMGQGSAMQQPPGLPQGSPYNGGYNPTMGGFSSLQPYGGGGY